MLRNGEVNSRCVPKPSWIDLVRFSELRHAAVLRIRDLVGGNDVQPRINNFDNGVFQSVAATITAIQNFDDIARGVSEMKRVSKGLVVISCLKKSPKLEFVEEAITSEFTITKKIEEEKDIIFFCNK